MGRLLIGAGTSAAGIINGTFASTFQASKKGVTRTAKFQMRVESDFIGETDTSILATPGVPVLYASYAGMHCKSVNPSHEYTVAKNHLGVPAQMWTLDVELSNEVDLEGIPPNADPLQPVNPTLIPADVTTDSITQIMPFDNKDADGKLIANYFGERLAAEIQNEVEVFIITITRWEPWPFPFTKSLQYNNTCNASPLHGLPEGTCLMKVRAPKQYYDGFPYARAQYQIKVLIDPEDPNKKDTWVDLTLPHIADRYLATAGDENSVRTVGLSGFEGPFYLKSDGTLAGFVNDFNDAQPDPDHVLKFKRKRKVDWGPLSIPNG